MKATTVVRVWRDGMKVQVGGQSEFTRNGRAEFRDTQEGKTYDVYVDGRKRDTVRGGKTISVTKD